MRKPIQPFQMHKHEDSCRKLNDMAILLKLFDDSLFNKQSPEQKEKILEVRKRYRRPTFQELTELVESVRDDISECTFNPIRH